MNKDNILSLKKIKSEAEFGVASIQELLNKIKVINEGFYISYLYNKVSVGKISEQFDNFDPSDLKMIRVFNKDAEIYAFNLNNNKFRYRLRKDGAGEEVFIVEANQVLIGTKSEKNNGKTKIFEDRGVELTVLFDVSVNNSKRLCIKTFNYVGFTHYGQATYVDSRIAGFTIMDKNGNITEVA